MKKTEYFCDICKKKKWKINLNKIKIDRGVENYYEKDICLNCLRKVDKFINNLIKENK